MRLRPLEAKDAEGMLSWMHDDSINSIFAADFKSFTKDKVLSFIENSDKNKDDLHLACVNDDDEY